MDNNNSEITRKMYITVDKTNEFREFDSHAMTLGDLKKELKAIGISYDGCSFMEATSLATYEMDESVLPTEVVSPTTGQKTSDLAFMLVSKNKNVNSGRSTSSVSLDRKKACQLIKDNKFEDKFVSKYGKKPSGAKTDDIYNFLVEVKLDDQIEVEKLDKFGNRIKNSKSGNTDKPAPAKEEKKEKTVSKKPDTVKEKSVEKVVEEPVEEVVEEETIVEETAPALVAGGVVEAAPKVIEDAGKAASDPVNKVAENVVNQCSKLVDKIGIAVYTIFKQEATKEDLIDLIESQSEEVQKEIMNTLTDRFIPKPSYSPDYIQNQMNIARRFKK